MKHLKTLRQESSYEWKQTKQWIYKSDAENAEYLWTEGYMTGAHNNHLKVPNKKEINKAAFEKYKSVTQINAFILGAEWAKKVYKKG
jgi:hypothetical protein